MTIREYIRINTTPFHNDYYDMPVVLKKIIGLDMRGCLNEADDMLRKYVDYILRCYRADLLLISDNADLFCTILLLTLFYVILI